MKLSIILLQRGWFVQVWFEMLAHLESTKMIRFLPKGSLHFQGVSTTKNNESLSANEDDVASSLFLKDMS